MEIFRVENISYTYRDGKKAVDSVSLRIRQGESLSVIGANGSGKSTLLYLLDGILKPQSGAITAFGAPLTDGSAEFRQKVSLLFQNPQVQLFSLSVWDELCFGPSQLGLPREEIESRASDILDLLGISHLKERGPWNLSGGEMKKVAMGTCLSINPDVILLDEPTTGLDPRSQVELIDLIVRLREAGKTIITATHDLGIIQDISDRTVVFGEDHTVMLEDNPWQALKNTDVLLRANLLHKHPHRHSWYVHEHSHSGLHEHEHIPDLIVSKAPGESAQDRPSESPDRSSDMEKLRILIEHWVEHNNEHAETYVQWAEKAKKAGIPDLAEMLKEIAAETKKIDALFAKAKKKAGG
jgi:cobalt/nickel transport system ATP-binding protein